MPGHVVPGLMARWPMMRSGGSPYSTMAGRITSPTSASEHGDGRRGVIEVADAADVERARVHLLLGTGRARVELGSAQQHFEVIAHQLDAVVVTDRVPAAGVDVVVADRSPAHGLAVPGERVVEHDVGAREHPLGYRPAAPGSLR